MKNDVVRWSKAQQQQKVKQEFPSKSEHLQNVASNKKLRTLTLTNALHNSSKATATTTSYTSTPATTTKATTISKHATKLAINCDNSLLVQPIESTNLPSRHFHRNATSLLQQVDSAYSLQQQRKQPQTNRCYRTFNATNCLHWLFQLTVLVILCQTNNGFALSLSSSNTNATSALSSTAAATLNAEIPYKLAYDDNSLSGTEGDGHFTHTWAVHIPNGDAADLANQVAGEHGFINLGKIFDDHYHFAHHKLSKRSLVPANEHQTRLDDDHRVHWAKQQKAKSRRKRDFIRMRPSRTSARSLSLVDAVNFDDPKWPQMWYLNRGGGLDMNVIPAWKDGITGKGIVVTILDDGLESDHPDIEHNYDPKASYDVNSHDDDPMPHYDLTDSNRHGTRCAGEVAATANNSKCAVGIAFGARVGGVRMLDGDVTDAVEARSLSLNPQHIDIYSASWGPDDDGKTVDGPGELASRAFLEGVTKGREGKGSIFIWASGNGGRELDNCNCDGYTNSIWTLSISSATEEGHVPWYSEKCSSTLATTYSSGSQTEKQVVTTDLHHSCTVSHTGTSASAPLAAGIAALVLESNTNLTWRDLQHIVVRTAKPANLKDPSWSKNGVGRRISHSFGYGLMDAAAMVKVARTWKTVPEQQRCEINAPHVDKVIPSLSYITLQLTVKHCSAVNYLEHVQAKITLTSQRRGDIQLYLKSPAGTKVTLLTSRKHDVSRSGFNQWPFMSVHTWGESPHGNWQLEIHNEGRYTGHALLREWSLIFYGTTQPIDANDPISIPRYHSAEHTTPNSSITTTTTNLHQIYSPQYPRISPNNFGASINGKIPMKLPPNKSVYVAPNTGMNNPLLEKEMKKQQQQQQQQKNKQNYQQISATYGVILGSQNKSNKQNGGGGGNSSGKGKNKSNESKGNKNGGKSQNNNSNNKKDQNAHSATATTTTANAKNKLYRILQQQQQQQQQQQNNKSNARLQNGVLLQAQRPKVATQSAEKSSMYMIGYDEKMSRKVIGDLPTTQTQKNARLPLKNAATSQTTSYAKLPIKATKQIKESALPPPAPPAPPATSRESMKLTDATLQQTHDKLLLQQPTALVTATSLSAKTNSDQRIPNIFDRYEKIQAIFPEFQPYQGTGKEKSSIALEKRKQAQIFEAETFRPFNAPTRSDTLSNANGGAVVSVSKPSRENSKKSPPSYVPDQKILKKQQLLLAAAGVSSSILDDSAPANRKTANAKITQWDLIFYGTETPAQPDDPVQLSPGQFSSYGNDMDNNDIDFDNSGQWRNMKQVGDNSLIHDKTNVSCLTTTSDNRCLACAPPTYLYNQHCYDMCPMHTYEIKATTTTDLDDNAVDNKAGLLDNELHKDIVIEDRFEQLQAMDRRKRSHFADDVQDNALPPVLPIKTTTTTNMCVECDKTCSRCYGPLNSQCSTCYPGSQLRKLLRTNETFCYAFTERSTGYAAGNLDNATHDKPHVLFVKVILIAMPVVVCVSLLAFFLISERKCRVPRSAGSGAGAGGTNSKSTTTLSTAHYAYDRVALLEADDMDAYADVEDNAADHEEIDIFTQPIAAADRDTNDERAHELVPAIIECESSDSDTDIFQQIHRI